MKVSGAIKNLVQGVSTQNPKERLEGQVWTMTNCIPDPVEGAVKRPAVKYLTSQVALVPTIGTPVDFISIATAKGEYALGLCGGTALVRSLENADVMQVFQEPSTVSYLQSGISAHTGIGEYTLLASAVPTRVKTLQSPSLNEAFRKRSAVDMANVTRAVNRVVVVEIRQGAYSGVYKIVGREGGVLASYTVPNGSVATHADNVQPAYIANQLYLGLSTHLDVAIGNGVLRAVHQQGASIAMFFEYAYVVAGEEESVALFTDDGFYNTRMVMSDRFTSNPSTLPALGIDGHIMEVGKADRRSGNYFVKFEHTQGSDTASNVEKAQLRPGRWVETSQSYLSTGYAAGGVLVPATLPTLMYIKDDKVFIGSGSYIAAQVLAQTGTVITPIKWGNREAGSEDSAADPMFVGSKITWLGTFQDRLVVVSDNAVSMSRTGDYLHFYRESVIDDLATDPINLSSTFDSSDTLVGAALLDKNLLVLGTKTHYSIVGRAALTPTNAALLKTSAFESSPNVPPVSFGNLVYFSSASDNNADILAIQPSDTADSTYAYPVSSHVDGYIPADIRSLTASTKLNILFVLGANGTLYGYRTLFNQGERVLSAWFDFKFPTDLELQCISVRNTKVRMLFVRVLGDTFITVVGELDLDRVGYTGVERHRYLDFWLDILPSTSGITFTDSYARGLFTADTVHCIDNTSNLLETSSTVTGSESGVPNLTYSNLMPLRSYMLGVPYSMTFEPTTPIPKSYTGEYTGVGKLVIGQMKVNYSIGSQFDVRVRDKFRDSTYSHAARVVSAPDSTVDTDYLRDGSFMFPIGSADTSARVSIYSNDHYPLVLSSIDWTGQFFKRGATM